MTDNRFGIVLDTHDAQALAPFWAAALRYTVIGGLGSYVLLLPEAGSGPKLLLQDVPEAKSAKNRMHLDVEVPDIEAEAERLEALGARRVQHQQVTEHGHSWILMTDPEGNEFCVCDSGNPT